MKTGKSYGFALVIMDGFGEPIPYWNIRMVLVAIGIIIALAALILFIFHYFSILRLNKKLADSIAQIKRNWKLSQSILDNTLSIVFIKDMDGRYILFNHQWEKLFNPDKKNMHGKTDYEIFPPDLAQKFRANDEMVIKSKTSVDFEESARISDGTIHTYLSIKSPILDENGKIFAVCGISTDITQHKEEEEELRKNRAFLSSVVEGTSDAIYIKDLQGRYLLFNRAAEKFTGKSAAQTIGNDDTFLFTPLEAAVVMEGDRKVMKAGKVLTYEEVVTPETGQTLTFLSTKGPIFDASGKVIGLFGIARNITDRKHAEEEIEKYHDHLEEEIKKNTLDLQTSQTSLINLLEDVNERSEELKRTTCELMVSKERAEEADRLKSAFLATMSHELRTPLNSIIGFTGIILDGLSGPINDEQKKQLNMVYNSSKHLLSLIQDILDVSKIESGQLRLNIASFDMHQAIETTVNTVTPLADEKGVALLVEIVPQEIALNSDQRRVEQVIFNLLSNAIKFTEKGEIKVECHASDGQVITRIIDTGIGIKPEHMDRLFKPFIQLDDRLSRRFEGTGLGLSISKKLVEMLGGSIDARSEYGKGSVFTFTLPIER